MKICNRKKRAEEIVAELADYLLLNGLDGEFRELALVRSESLCAEDIAALRSLFHAPPKESQNYDFREHGLGGWLRSCQFAIFEIFFNLGEAVLPFIREVAWGEYDWTQGNAIELLLRFAAKDVRRDTILDEVKEKFSGVRLEAQLYAIQPLVPELTKDPELGKVFAELMAVDSFRKAYDELTEDA